MATTLTGLLAQANRFGPRHLGASETEVRSMLEYLGVPDLDTLIADTMPAAIRMDGRLQLPPAHGEDEVIDRLRKLADQNTVLRSLIGLGYHDCVTPPVIQRNVLENPGWYTQYTPYQAEISQGRLEALLNFQTMVSDLTGLPMANSSLLDEATAAAEAMAISFASNRRKKTKFFVADHCHPQTIEVIQTRAEPLGIELTIGPADEADFSAGDYCGLLLQYPDTHGRLTDHSNTVTAARENGVLVTMATDLLALTMITPPGELGADIAIGNTQRFGVSLGLGGPHAAFIATHDKFRRLMPGRIVGVSKDASGGLAYRLALQTREQHIRRESATSNICTAQVLLAIMASMYAVYHGPDGLRRIGRRVHGLTKILAHGLSKLGHDVGDAPFFDTLTISVGEADTDAIHRSAVERGINLRRYPDGRVGVALDERSTLAEVSTLLAVFGDTGSLEPKSLANTLDISAPDAFRRTSDFLTHPVFSSYHSEHEMLRYLHRLQAKDLSLTTSMIPLGSCTMKLNATTEMLAVTWPEFAGIHPFAPADQWAGYGQLFQELEVWLSEITGFAGISLQPNAGAQGEYAGLLVIRAYHRARGDAHRNICLIPTSAHGTNPASAVMAGMKVVPVKCNERGDVDLEDLRARAEQHADNLAALMITYPSTHGVFEAAVKEVCELIHERGGQVYMDGANMNAQVGLCRPGDFGADVCHLNLHKTFCIPHGGGGPGMGPIGVAAHLVPFLPGHGVAGRGGPQAIGAVSAAPYGSPSILPISYSYIAMMGEPGLRRATEQAILAANYMAARIDGHFDVLYTGDNGRVAHEFIIDCRGFKKSAGITVDDIAKRLMDYGFHAPTMSFPVAGTLMIEPTESEAKSQLDSFCDALIAIREEISAIERGEVSADDNALKNAPHTAARVSGTEWPHAYSREHGAWPAPWLKVHKYWPPVGRVDNAYGDRNPICTCPGMDEYEA